MDQTLRKPKENLRKPWEKPNENVRRPKENSGEPKETIKPLLQHVFYMKFVIFPLKKGFNWNITAPIHSIVLMKIPTAPRPPQNMFNHAQVFFQVVFFEVVIF